MAEEAPRVLITDFETTDYLLSQSGGTAELVANPLKDDINNSDNVIKFTNESASEWWGRLLVLEVENHIVADGFENFEFMVKAPAQGTISIKLENSNGDPQPSIYQEAQVSEGWQTIKASFDLTDVPSTAKYNKIVIFFNINDLNGGDVWYIDNLATYGTVENVPFPKPVVRNEVTNFETEDFKFTASGASASIIDNPLKNEQNNSEKVLSFTNSATDGNWWDRMLIIEVENRIVIDGFEHIEFNVNAPATGSVFIKLEKEDDGTTGDKQPETYQEIQVQEGWQTIKTALDLNNVPEGAVYSKIVMSFNINDLTAENTWLVDNFAVYGDIQNVPFPKPVVRNEVTNFETEDFKFTASGATASIIDNPLKNDQNNSEKVLSFTNSATDGNWWDRMLILEVENRIVIDGFEHIEFNVNAPATGSVFIKLEKEDDGTTGDKQPETYQEIQVQEGWQTIKTELDLNNVPEGAVYSKIVMSFNINDLTAENTWLVDNFAVYGDIQNVPFPKPIVRSEVTNFETEDFKFTASGATASIIDNPLKNEQNNSEKVLSFTNSATDGNWWDRMLIIEVENRIVIDGFEHIEFNVNAPATGSVFIKLEKEDDGTTGDKQPETYQEIQVQEGWQTIKTALDLNNVPEGAVYSKIVMSFNINDLTAENTWLVDNFAVYGDIQNVPFPVIVERNKVTDFEGEDFKFNASGATASIIDNPLKNEQNNSEKVLSFTNSATDGNWWDRMLIIEVENRIVIDGFEHIEFNVNAPATGSVFIKLEKEDDGTTGDKQPETYQEIQVQEGWQTIKTALDLNNVPEGAVYSKIVMSFNINDLTAENTWLVDNFAVYGDIQNVPFPVIVERNKVTDFEGEDVKVSASGAVASIVDNPLKNEQNGSDKVISITNAPTDGEWWNRMLILEVENQIVIDGLEHIEFMIHAPVTGNVFLKLEKEDDATTGDTQPETYQEIQVQEGWQTIKVPLNVNNVPTDAVYNKIVMSFNINDLTSDKTWLIDNFGVYGDVQNVPFPEPEPEPEVVKAPQNLYFTNITADGFTLHWTNDPLATEGTNVFLEEAGTKENIYITTLSAENTSYRYENGKDGVTLKGNTVYIPRIQSLPDPEHQAYANGVINLENPAGADIEFDEKFHIFLAFGQSNMEGSAPIDPSLDYQTDSRLKVFQSIDCDNLNRQKEMWYDLFAPSCQCYTQYSVVDGFGAGMLDELPEGHTVGIINVAIGGTDIRIFDKDQYQNFLNTNPEEWFKEKVAGYGNNPYQHLVNLAKLAQKSGTIEGILLHQGEANAGNAEWPNYVTKIYNDLITDIGLNAEEVPLLSGQLSTVTYTEMNQIIATLPNYIDNAHIISSEGVSVSEDNVHFDRAGAETLGRRYATKMLELITFENEGDGNEGDGNEGDGNEGDGNEGDGNEGDGNEGDGNEGDGNEGDGNEGDGNEGDGNEGDGNEGDGNEGDGNEGDGNEGDGNEGDGNEGDGNEGDGNEGDGNEGDGNEGDGNEGDGNEGDGNEGDGNEGDGNEGDGNEGDGNEGDGNEGDGNEGDGNEGDGNEGDGNEGEIPTSVDVEQAHFSLDQNYPNPVVDITNISFTLKQASFVSIKVYHQSGTLVKELAGRRFKSGKNAIIFNAEGLTAGVYIYVMEVDRKVISKRMIVK
ncbi:hypothetical protein AVL50_20600 [Flammeovirga sp. SJP92]|nr:hypothetical protein AVL50_20600 [Flammeovirga sp. SJP92]